MGIQNSCAHERTEVQKEEMNQSLSTSDRQPHLESPRLSRTQRLLLYSVAGSQARTWQDPRQNQTMEDECRFKHTTLGHGYVLKYSHA